MERKYLRDLENENIENITVFTEDNALKAILTKELSLETEKMLECLSEEDREIFIKLYFEEKNMDEISCDTGLPNRCYTIDFQGEGRKCGKLSV